MSASFELNVKLLIFKILNYKIRLDSYRDIWLFLVPFVCIIAARSLIRVKCTEGRYLVPLVLVSQWITILLTKMNQDFY